MQPTRTLIDVRPNLAILRDSLRSPDQSAISLEEFLTAMDQQSLQQHGEQVVRQHQEVVDQAIRLLGGLYVHLPFKQSRYAANPLGQLRVLRGGLPQMTKLAFHSAILQVFRELHDPHTTFRLPEPFSSARAFLPFLLERCFTGPDQSQPQLLITRVHPAFADCGLLPGMELTHWNGMPIEMALESMAQKENGANPAARMAMAVANLTVRPLRYMLAPEELTVVARFQTPPRRKGQRPKSIDFLLEWSVLCGRHLAAPPVGNAPPAGTASRTRSQNQRSNDTHALRQLLFNRPTPLEEGWESLADGAVQHKIVPMRLPPSPASNNARLRVRVGILRIRTFDRPNPSFVNEIANLLEGPWAEKGVDVALIDIRGNSGGQILNGEQLLQLFSAGPISAATFQFLNTPLVRHLSRPESRQTETVAAPEASANRFARALELARRFTPILEDLSGFGLQQDTGALYSRGAPITKDPNTIGQCFFGRVALITDAMSYSTADIFAAGFQDHRLGPVIGVDESTGGGGANVWNYSEDLATRTNEEGRPFPPLPDGMDFSVSVRHSLRVGRFHGDLLEDFGVRPDYRYRTTRKDLLSCNSDLYQFAVNQVHNTMDLCTVHLDVRAFIDESDTPASPEAGATPDPAAGPSATESRVPAGHCDLAVEVFAEGVQFCELVVNGKVARLIDPQIIDIDKQFIHDQSHHRLGPGVERPKQIQVNGYSLLPPSAVQFYSEQERAQMQDQVVFVLVASRRLAPGHPRWFLGPFPETDAPPPADKP